MHDLSRVLNHGLAGRYRILREVGRGGAAVIYLAEDLRHRRQVALKVLRPDISASIGAGRFLREVQIAAQLTHPHILPVHDSGEVKGLVYYVMPVVKGESLRGRIVREGQLRLPETVRVLHDVLDALHYAHGRGVVHRDIKPDNVLLSGRNAMVADFGVAKAVSAAAEATDVDTLGMVIGTPAYMAPEQASADPSIDHRADLYSVGAVAYEMLTGRPPFEEPSTQAMVSAHLSKIPDPVSVHRPDVPSGLAEIVMRSLEKRPADRWESADEVLHRLEGEVTPIDVHVSTGGWRARRARRPIMAGGVLVLLVVIALLWMWRGLPSADASDRPMLVVLPFQNLGPADDDYFAHGVTDAITARLASLGTLGVISRTSALQYAGTAFTVQKIAADLRVDYVLEGTIQRERPSDPASRVRIIPRLVRVSDDTQLWSGVYDEQLERVFQLQSDIAERVARALDLALAAPAGPTAARRPTENLEAYELYLRGHEYLAGNVGGGDANARRIAVDLFERALALDGAFALAWAELSLAHMWLYYWYVDPTDQRLRLAKVAVDTALALAPDLPEAHLALGHYYQWGPEPEPAYALEEFEIVARRDPSNAYARSLLARLQAARGRWDEALHHAALAADLDPREPDWAAGAGKFYLLARQYEAAERYLDRAISLAPDLTEAHRDKLALYLRWQGDTARAAAVVDEMARHVTAGEVAQALVDVAPVLVVGGKYDTLFTALTPGSIAGPLPFDYLFVRAEFYRLRNRPEPARAYYDSLLTAANAVETGPGRAAAVSTFRGVAAAAVGQVAFAMRQAEQLERILVSRDDGAQAAGVQQALLTIYALIGDTDRAVELVERLLAGPSLLSIPHLRTTPLPEGLRRHPRFRRLLGEGF